MTTTLDERCDHTDEPVPEEFRLQEPQQEESSALADLFCIDEDKLVTETGSEMPAYSSGRPVEGLEEVTVANYTFYLKTPPDIGTLFAHRVWSGSRYLAEFLASHADKYVRGRRTAELGAGTGLPSLVCLAHGSNLSVISDFPDDALLQALRETVGLNWKAIGKAGRVSVVGHEWGTSVDNLLEILFRDDKDGAEELKRYELVILSECLWMHRSHEQLAKSVDSLLVRPGNSKDANRDNDDEGPNVEACDSNPSGYVVVTYAHHIPGCEEADDAFFTLCSREYGIDIVHEECREGLYMWDASKRITIFLKVLARR
jgi:EEF1A N-terminal glycine/lysine methyltransferase